jgi:hypothetical protein
MLDDKSVYVSYANIKHQTDLAILFVINGGEIWLPKSEIQEHDEISKVIIIPKWLAQKNSLKSDW